MPAKKTPEELEVLVERVKRREESAIVEFYELYRWPLYCLFRRIGRSEAEAEELADELLCLLCVEARILRYPHKDGGSFDAWIMKVARNFCIDCMRQRRIVMNDESLEDGYDKEGDNEILKLLASHPDYAQHTSFSAYSLAQLEKFSDEEKTDINRAVLAALDVLPRGQRAVLELQLVGMTDKQIASALGISETNVRVRRHRVKGSIAFQQRLENDPRLSRLLKRCLQSRAVTCDDEAA